VPTHDITIYGASDDLIEIEGNAQGCDEYPGEDGVFVLIGDEAKVRVRVTYTARGLWAIAAQPVEEDVPMLPIFLTGSGYSARAEVHGVRLVVHEVPA
jgi:hypothetical protein